MYKSVGECNIIMTQRSEKITRASLHLYVPTTFLEFDFLPKQVRFINESFAACIVDNGESNVIYRTYV